MIKKVYNMEDEIGQKCVQTKSDQNYVFYIIYFMYFILFYIMYLYIFKMFFFLNVYNMDDESVRKYR